MAYAYLNDGSLSVCNKLSSVPEGIESVEFERGGLPAAPDTLTIVDGAIVVDPVKAALVAEKEAGALRDTELSEMVYTTPEGSVIQCRLKDEQNIRTALDIITRNNLTGYPWRLADDTTGVVTKADLEAAIISGQDQGAAIWQKFFADIAGGE